MTTDGTIVVAIVETSVYGVLAYHARCLNCGKECHREPHDREATAVRHAEQHVCAELTTSQVD